MASAIPVNKAEFSAQQIVDATGASVDGNPIAQIRGVSTDTRAVQVGTLFVALAGETFDGHNFIERAVENGAVAVLVDRACNVPDQVTVFRVSCTLEALGKLGQYHRGRFTGPILAVAGSVGKTTTRSTVAAVLRAMGSEVHCPSGNLNNRVGVPLVLLGLTASHSVGVVELGTSLPGEVACLVEMAQPTIAILTRISIEHSEGLGDLNAIEQEEGAVLRGLDRDAIAIVNADDERCVRQLAARRQGPSIVYGLGGNSSGGEDSAGARYCIETCEVLNSQATRVTIKRPNGSVIDTTSPLLGQPGAYALAAAIAAAESCLGQSIGVEQLELALTSSELGEPGRLCPIALSDGSLILDDTYNSSPASVLSSVEVARGLAAARNSRLVLVLGEMRELGDRSAEIHAEVGRQLVGVGAQRVIAFGGDAQFFLPAALAERTESCFEADPLSVAKHLSQSHCPGDVILVKSSRGLRAERIVQQIADAIGRQS